MANKLPDKYKHCNYCKYFEPNPYNTSSSGTCHAPLSNYQNVKFFDPACECFEYWLHCPFNIESEEQMNEYAKNELLSIYNRLTRNKIFRTIGYMSPKNQFK